LRGRGLDGKTVVSLARKRGREGSRQNIPPWTQKIWSLMTTLSVKKSNMSVK
jgi:hypothetical protein